MSTLHRAQELFDELMNTLRDQDDYDDVLDSATDLAGTARPIVSFIFNADNLAARTTGTGS